MEYELGYMLMDERKSTLKKGEMGHIVIKYFQQLHSPIAMVKCM